MTVADLRYGVVEDMPEVEYHAHPALSSSGARKLLPPSCPAIFDHERHNPPEPKAVFDLGSAAHKLVLGAGQPIRVIDAPDWRTKAAQAERAAAREADEIPLLTHEHEQVKAMAAALGLHPVARQLFREGTAELSLFWRDDRSGVECRARFDWLTENAIGDAVVVDYKTCASADPRHIARSVASFGYHVQQAWYMDAARATGVADDPGFLFVCQEKSPPYVVTVASLDREAVEHGAHLARRARSIFAECEATGEWPIYSDDVVRVSVPSWAVDA